LLRTDRSLAVTGGNPWPAITEEPKHRPCLEWSTDADSQASGWAYGGAGVGGSLTIAQTGVWSAGGHLIIVVRVVRVL